MDQEELQILGVDQFFQVRRTTNLGLIRDVANPFSKAVRVEATLLREEFHVGGPNIDTLEFTDMCDTPAKMTQFEPQASNTAEIF